MPLFDWVQFNKDLDQFDPAAYLNEVLNQCHARRCRKVILSSEFFWAAPAMQAASAEYHRPTPENFAYIKHFLTECRKLFRAFSTITIVVYLRRQDYWIDSFFNHQVKDGFDTPSQEELLRETKNYLLYHKNIAIQAEVFGRENLVIRNYDKLLNGDIIADFSQIVELQPDLLEYAPKSQNIVNSKLSKASVHIMRKAREQGFDAEALALFRTVLQGLSFRTRSHKRKREHTLFEPQFYEQVLELYHQDNQRLAEEYIDLTGLAPENGRPQPAQPAGAGDTGGDECEEKCEELITLLLARLSEKS